MLFLSGGDGTTSVRMAVRPSGTEPKLKFYLEVVADDGDTARAVLAALADDAKRVC